MSQDTESELARRRIEAERTTVAEALSLSWRLQAICMRCERNRRRAGQ